MASEDDGLVLLLWPGALGEWLEFEIETTEMAPASFGQAYKVSPNLALGIDAEIIMRGDLPDPASLVRVGAVAATDADLGTWEVLALEPGGINENDDTVRGHDDEVAMYYAMIDDGEDPGTSTTTDSTSSSDSGDPTGPPLSFMADIQPIFDASCTNPTSCHGVSPSGSLSLDVDAYQNIVGVRAHIDGNLTRVISGDPDNSLLMNKVDYMPPPTGGIPMPTGGQLPAETADLIRNWIAQDCPP